MQEIQIINRTINIPPELKENIVVEGDSNSQILTFSINRYFDGVDLTTKTIQVAYQNALGQSQYSDAYLKAIDAENDTFTFDWALPSGIAIKDGEVQISVEFSETVNGVKTYIWKTKPATFYVEDSFPVFGNAQSPDYTLAKKFVDNNNNLGVSQLNDTDEPILIEGREILVPSLIDVVVEGDNKSQIISFKMDRYFKNVDRSTKVISVAYTNALGQSERSPIYNAVVTEDYIIFGWVIDGKVAAKEGIVNFYIECQGNTDEGFYCWKTKPAQLMISKGLKVTGSIPDPTPSWYQIAEQNIKEDLETAKSYAEQAEESANEANNIKNEVIQLKESIETAEPERQAAEQERREYINSLRPYLDTFIETIGIGLEYGGEITPTDPPSLNVNVAACVAHMPDGQTFNIDAQQLIVSANNTNFPRTDIIYVSKYGALSYLASTIKTIAGSRTYTFTKNFVGNDQVNVCGIIVVCGLDFGSSSNDIESNVASLASCINWEIGDKYIATASGNVLTITEKNAGSGNTPTEMTITGTAVVINGEAIESAIIPVPAEVPAGGLLLYELNMPVGATVVLKEYLIDRRKFTYGLHSYVKDKTFESIGARMNETEEDVASLQARTTRAETDIDSLQTSIAGHDAEIDALQVRSAQTDAEIDALRVAQAQMSTDTRIDLPGTGKVTAVPKNAAVLGVGGTIKGMTLTPLVAQSNVPIGSSVTFNSVSGNKYYDGLHKTILTGTGSEMVVTNDTSAAANIYVIDLNAHGLQTKTAGEMMQICPNYISGTQSVMPMRVKSIGKNIFNIDKPLKYYKDNPDKNYPLKIENGIIYSAGKNGVTRGEGVYVEINGLPVTISFNAEWSSDTSDTKFYRFILFNELASDRMIRFGFSDSTTRIIQEKNVITVPANNYKYVGISFWGREPYQIRITNLQIEYGTEATEYELYKETTCYIEPKPLRRLPNGVCDTVDLATGKRTINVKEYTLQESDIKSIYPGMTSFDIAQIKKPNDFIGFGSMTQTLNFSIEGYKTTPVILDGKPIYLNCVTAYWDNSYFALALNKGVTLAQAREMLVGKKLYYQLATPVIENNVVAGTLLSYPKGLIVCEPVIADAGVYNDGVTILRVDYPIQSLETLCKVNADGTQTPLDVSAATITDAGTKITHPALFNGDIVAFTYFTASSGIIGENVYNYVNANGLTLGADGKYYKVGFAIDINGNITLTKTEVV